MRDESKQYKKRGKETRSVETSEEENRRDI